MVCKIFLCQHCWKLPLISFLWKVCKSLLNFKVVANLFRQKLQNQYSSCSKLSKQLLASKAKSIFLQTLNHLSICQFSQRLHFAFSARLFATVGCHPTRCNEFEEYSEGAEGYLSSLKDLIDSNPGKVVAIGECGLDNDRLKFCDAKTQQKWVLPSS